MDHAYTHRSTMDPEMSTTNRGMIIDQMRASRGSKHEASGLDRNSFLEPDEFIVGAHGDEVGGNDPENQAERC